MLVCVVPLCMLVNDTACARLHAACAAHQFRVHVDNVAGHLGLGLCAHPPPASAPPSGMTCGPQHAHLPPAPRLRAQPRHGRARPAVNERGRPPAVRQPPTARPAAAAHLAQQRRGGGGCQARRAVQLHHLGRLRQHGLRGARPRARCLRSSGIRVHVNFRALQPHHVRSRALRALLGAQAGAAQAPLGTRAVTPQCSRLQQGIACINSNWQSPQ